MIDSFYTIIPREVKYQLCGIAFNVCNIMVINL